MSFILDALKKSELERQRQTLPGLVEAVGPRARGRFPVWAIALAALLGVNLLVLGFLLSRSASSPPPPAAALPSRTGSPAAAPSPVVPPAATAPAVPIPAAPPAAAFSPMAAAPDYAPEIPVSGAVAEAGAPADPDTSRSARVGRRQDPVLTQPLQDYQPVDEEVLPTINEVTLTGAAALPDLHLDVHVFATRAADRFVYINMRKYHEGATLQEGPVIERIRRDGVVLRWQNLRFLLPRQ